MRGHAQLGYLPVRAVAGGVKGRKYGGHEFPEKTAMLMPQQAMTSG
jgi:hypothetical protein